MHVRDNEAHECTEFNRKIHIKCGSLQEKQFINTSHERLVCIELHKYATQKIYLDSLKHVFTTDNISTIKVFFQIVAQTA